ncbi:hypothetical protein [Frigidibacter sp.]|uniref:hypothetical protein n=1 Tax=Frigidibacter sp. TaxID=2586418 RepID=UPI0027357704|nr:hypothetical protein [Frigidibacter sp.]MDP3338950.1 hypothetical protein [Frigidibacter sp.]
MAMQDNLDTGTVQGMAGDWLRRFAAGFRAAPIPAHRPPAAPRQNARDPALPEPLVRRAAAFDPAGAQATDFDLVERALLAKRHVVLVGGSGDKSLLDHTLWLEDQVADLQSAPDLGHAAGMVAPLAPDTGLLVVDIDALRADAVTALQAFRDRYPDIAVVIGSRRFARNDFSCERALIADASLRLPARRIAFALAMSSAIHNNRVIRSR